MKIAFIFTEEADLANVPAGGRFRSNFEVTDAAKTLPDLEARVIAIAEFVGQLTRVNLHLTCPDIGLKDHPIKQNAPPIKIGGGLVNSLYASCLYFKRSTHYESKRSLAIYAPIESPISSPVSISRAIERETNPDKKAYLERIQVLSDQLLPLLNADNPSQAWGFNSFDPSAWQQALFTREKKRLRKFRSEDRKREREEEKRKAREAKLADKRAANPQPEPPTHGAGRTIGARPGIYKDVQMRSQLEIRFAAELDERGIQWVYEGEALSASSYLVDFYLPDLGAWVEVKGRFEARDRQVLPEVAKYLKAERKQRLLIYTGSGKCCVVNPSGFREVERKNFWGELLR